jgi:hypothetical protein
VSHDQALWLVFVGLPLVALAFVLLGIAVKHA